MLNILPLTTNDIPISVVNNVHYDVPFRNTLVYPTVGSSQKVVQVFCIYPKHTVSNVALVDWNGADVFFSKISIRSFITLMLPTKPGTYS